MKRLIVSSVVMVGGLTGCAADRMDGQSGVSRISGAFSGVVALVASRSPRPGQSFDLVAERARHRRARRRSAEIGGGPDGAIPGDVLTGEPERRRPAP